jgi:hypothetical protein
LARGAPKVVRVASGQIAPGTKVVTVVREFGPPLLTLRRLPKTRPRRVTAKVKVVPFDELIITGANKGKKLRKKVDVLCQ